MSDPISNPSKTLRSCLPSAVGLDDDTIDYIAGGLCDVATREDLIDFVEPFISQCEGADIDVVCEQIANAFHIGETSVETQAKPQQLLNTPFVMANAIAAEAEQNDVNAGAGGTGSDDGVGNTDTGDADGAISATKTKISRKEQKREKRKEKLKKTRGGPKLEDGEIVSVSRVSRFQAEVVAGEKQEVNLFDVCITIGGKELLSGAHLQLLPGRRYGLVGRNGVGKTTLLDRIASGKLVGFPPTIRVLYVAQEVDGDDRPPLDVVLGADTQLVELQWRESVLRQAIDCNNGSVQTAAAAAIVARLKLAEAREHRDIANKRSGSKGLAARDQAMASEAAARVTVRKSTSKTSEMVIGDHPSEAVRCAAEAVREATRRVEEQVKLIVSDGHGEEVDEELAVGGAAAAAAKRGYVSQDTKAAAIVRAGKDKDGNEVSAVEEAISAVTDASATQAALEIQRKETAAKLAAEVSMTADDLLGDIYAALGELDAEGAEGRAESILLGLGFARDTIRRPAEELSGGWRMRVALAQALFMKPELLLLDEPTNHLDLHSVLWLQSYLVENMETSCLLTVSHDREFLNSVVTEVILLRNQTLQYHAGNFDAFEERCADLLLKRQRLVEGQERRKKQLADSIAKMTSAASKTNDDKRLAQVASRKKKLLERGGVDKNADGTRFKMSYVGLHQGLDVGMKRQVATIEATDPPIQFKIPAPDNIGSYGAVLQLDDMTVGYTKGKPIIRNVTMQLDTTSRVGLLGRNGQGKSTLMNVLGGYLEPWCGSKTQHHNLRIASFTQHQIDTLDPDSTPLALMMVAGGPATKEQQCRGHLGSFGLSGRLAIQRCGTLSGGQKARCVLALTTWSRPHILLLDEPSNHLDHDSIDALAEALTDFQGGIVVASHDLRLVNAVANELYVVDKGHVKPFDGTLEEYTETLVI